MPWNEQAFNLELIHIQILALNLQTSFLSERLCTYQTQSEAGCRREPRQDLGEFEVWAYL